MAPRKEKTGKGKKIVSQEELRRLMKEKQKESTTKKKQVESPFAKYNSVGQLNCVVCGVPVKSDILWQAHVLGKTHKEKVNELKTVKKPESASPTASAVKRKATDCQAQQVKRGKPDGLGSSTSQLPADFFAGDESGSGKTSQPSALGSLAGNYDEEEEDEEETQADKSSVDQTNGTHSGANPAAPGLPADFFDSNIPSVPAVSHSGSVVKADECEKAVERKENTAEALPEGFFDDPVRDAKIRKVDAPKDLMDKEWEEFQKEMRQVNNASEAIVAEDDEDVRLERQIDEIDEQIECYRRVELLRDKRDVAKQVKRPQCLQQQEDSSEEDEEDLLHILAQDWRAKGALL